MKKRTKWLSAGLLVLAMLATTMTPSADAWSGRLGMDSYDGFDHGMLNWVRGDFSNWGCGLKDCANTSSLRGGVSYRSSRDRGAKVAPDQVQMRMITGFSGVRLSVGVSTSGASASFTDWGSSCGQGWVRNPVGVRSISLTTSGEICKASTWGWISNVYIKTESQYRQGNNWYTAQAYSGRKIGGL